MKSTNMEHFDSHQKKEADFCQMKQKTIYCSVNHVFNMKVLIGDSILTSPNRERTAIFV